MSDTPLTFNVYVQPDGEVHSRLRKIESQLAKALKQTDLIITNQENQMADLTTLQAAVEEDLAVDTSAVVLIEQLADLIEQAGDDPAALQALVDQLRSQSAALAEAVVANTPAAPDPPPEP